MRVLPILASKLATSANVMSDVDDLVAYRFEKKCANLATIDLNSLLFKYECDIAYAIKEFFGDSLELEEDFELQSFPFGTALPFDASAGPASPEELDFESLKLSGRSSIGAKQTSSEWVARATRRRQLMDHYLCACRRSYVLRLM